MTEVGNYNVSTARKKVFVVLFLDTSFAGFHTKSYIRAVMKCCLQKKNLQACGYNTGSCLCDL